MPDTKPHQRRISVSNPDTDYDLNVYSIGLEQTKPDKKVGPCVRSKYVIHYCLGGSGQFCGERLSRGKGFLICPDKLHSYSSDTDAPLKYGWISFFGSNACKLLESAGLPLENHIFECGWVDELDGIFEWLSNPCKSSDADEYLRGCFHILISFHIKAQNDKNSARLRGDPRKEYIAKAIKHIKTNYNRQITVSEVASELYLSPHYLSNLFHDELGISPLQYIMRVKMKRAAELLLIDELQISDIAHSVGYTDALAFSKLFKKHYGVSPKEFRRSKK